MTWVQIARDFFERLHRQFSCSYLLVPSWIICLLLLGSTKFHKATQSSDFSQAIWEENLAHKRSIFQAIKLENDGRAMNGLGVRELCCLFCCPPWPSKIAAKLAFLPPEPTYTFVEENGAKQAVCLSDRAEWQYSEREKENMEVFYTRTSRQNRIACMFIRFVPVTCSCLPVWLKFLLNQMYT